MDEPEIEQDQDYDTISTGGSPGDGVCPPVSSLQAIFQAAYESWVASASRQPPDGQDNLFDMDKFIQLMYCVQIGQGTIRTCSGSLLRQPR